MAKKTVSGAKVLCHYTAKYTKIEAGYLGQLVEWPEVVTEGRTLESCRTSLRDALREMIQTYHQLRREIPQGGGLLEQISVERPKITCRATLLSRLCRRSTFNC